MCAHHSCSWSDCCWQGASADTVRRRRQSCRRPQRGPLAQRFLVPRSCTPTYFASPSLRPPTTPACEGGVSEVVERRGRWAGVVEEGRMGEGCGVWRWWRIVVARNLLKLDLWWVSCHLWLHAPCIFILFFKILYLSLIKRGDYIENRLMRDWFLVLVLTCMVPYYTLKYKPAYKLCNTLVFGRPGHASYTFSRIVLVC